MNLVDVATWLTFGCIPAFLVLDLIHRARRFETPRLWRLRALVVTVFAVAASFAVPMLWTALLGDWTLLNLASLGTWAGAAVAVLVYQVCHYWYHRLVHRSDFLFRWFHQMHHSAESLDAFGAYYLSPLDVFAFVSIATLVFVPLLGVSGEAAVVGNLFLTFCAMFQHANVKTPQWLGYLVQRPESHGVHHERGVHRYNYCDLPVIDMLFGTFRNPETFDAECGYWNGASSKIAAMLLGRWVTEAPKAAEAQSEEGTVLRRVA